MMEAPYKVQVDPEKARELAQCGAVILLLDVPNGTVIGIDQQVSGLPKRFFLHSIGFTPTL